MLKSHSFLVDRDARAKSVNKSLLPHEIEAINNKRIKRGEKEISDFNLTLIEQRHFVKAWRDHKWFILHNIKFESVAYKFAECILRDNDFLSCESLGFERIEKIQLIFLLISLSSKKDEEALLARQAMRLLKSPEDEGLLPLEAILGNKKLCRYSERNNPGDEIYYESLAINPEFNTDLAGIDEAELTEKFNKLKVDFFEKLSGLKKAYDTCPEAKNYNEMMSLWYAKDFIKELMANKSKSGLFNTGLFTSTRIDLNSSLDDIITNAKREDKVTRCRVLCIKRGWFQVINKELALSDQAPKPVKDAWNRLAKQEEIYNSTFPQKRPSLTIQEMKDRIRAYREFTKVTEEEDNDIKLFNLQRDTMAATVNELWDHWIELNANENVEQENTDEADIKNNSTILNGDLRNILENLQIILTSYPQLPEKVKTAKEIEQTTRARIEHHALFLELAGQYIKEMHDDITRISGQMSDSESLLSQLRMRP